ncbi:MAG: phosphate ABC transporter substrate-binding protein [Alteromonas sp.]|nr:phosphate ABC transporter substrate-binding protein [Alteromonas sp.]|tara:strand:+ start:132 stop:893 length:762 start_codon:yes stop_codon:yes gene_type:complete
MCETLTFGIVPQQSAKKLAETWQPLIDYLEENTSLSIEFQTAKNIPTFEARLANGDYDIAYMNPYHYVVFSDSPGYQALVKQKDKKITGIIVVRADSPIQTLDELNGMQLAFPAPAAFAATIIPSAHLRQQNISISPHYVYSHDSVYLNVVREFFPAGGGIVRTLGTTDETIQQNLRVLWKSQGFTPHAIATHPDVSEEVRIALENAFLALSPDATHQALLHKMGFTQFESAQNSDWDDVRALGIVSLARPHL